jgi:DNA ligase-1
MTSLIKPMLLNSQDEVESKPDWLYEPKHDGFRLLVENKRSYTRHGTITTSRLPELYFGGEDMLLDGELIAPGEHSPDDFAGAMARFSGNNEQPIQFRAFDLISYQGKRITSLPIQKRKEMLSEVIAQIGSPHIVNVPFVVGEGEALFHIIKQNNMEGIVAKRLDSLYVPDKRSDDWRKIINWTFHDAIATKISFKPFTVQLKNVQGDYLGSVTIGFKKKIKEELLSGKLPFAVKVKSRGWTSGRKLRLPQIIKVE